MSKEVIKEIYFDRNRRGERTLYLVDENDTEWMLRGDYEIGISDKYPKREGIPQGEIDNDVSMGYTDY